MDKQAFKQRMQNLKSYRENNPGKGYWEKNFIINYLIECLVDNQPFDCSSLGPNKYLNE